MADFDNRMQGEPHITGAIAIIAFELRDEIGEFGLQIHIDQIEFLMGKKFEPNVKP